jgi:hypothetical protein
MASSICARSWRSCSRIALTSIDAPIGYSMELPESRHQLPPTRAQLDDPLFDRPRVARQNRLHQKTVRFFDRRKGRVQIRVEFGFVVIHLQAAMLVRRTKLFPSDYQKALASLL